MKCLLIFLFFLPGLKGYSQLFVTVQWQPFYANEAGDTIYYDVAKKLAWKDFKGIPQARSNAAAITASGFGYSMAMNSRNNRTNIVITVNCFFIKTDSWVKGGVKSDYALQHEQHHFDITYYHAFRFIQKLKAAAFTRSNYESLLEQLNNETYAEMEKMQDDYDGQTKHARLKEVQYEWNDKVDKLLVSLIIK